VVLEEFRHPDFRSGSEVRSHAEHPQVSCVVDASAAEVALEGFRRLDFRSGSEVRSHAEHPHASCVVDVSAA
jgi:hypothetical protein